MQRRRLALTLIVIGAVGGVALWRSPLILGGGSVTLPSGPDTFAHDGYLSVPAGLPVACLVFVGLALLSSLGHSKDAA